MTSLKARENVEGEGGGKEKGIASVVKSEKKRNKKHSENADTSTSVTFDFVA